MRSFLLCLMLSVCGQCYALDKYTDEMTSTTGWTDNDQTGGAFTQTTFDGRSCFKFTVTPAGSGNVSSAYRVLPVGGQNQSIKIVAYFDSIGTSANVDYASFSFRSNNTAGNMTTVYFASDGLFTSGTDTASRYEVGTNIVDQDVWTEWEFRIVAVTPATAVMAVYKNGIYIDGSLDVSRLDGGTLDNRFTFIQNANTLNNATTYVDSLSVTSYGMNYSENMDSITDWTDTDAGNGVSSQATFDSVSTMKLEVATASGTSKAQRVINIGNAFTNKFVVEMKAYISSVGTVANSDFCMLLFSRTATTNNYLAFASDGLFKRYGSATWVEIGTDVVTTGSWSTWRFEVDTALKTINVKKDGVLIANGVTFGYDGATIAGQISLTQYGFTKSGVLSYIDYLRIYSEDGQLLQTIIE